MSSGEPRNEGTIHPRAPLSEARSHEVMRFHNLHHSFVDYGQTQEERNEVVDKLRSGKTLLIDGLTDSTLGPRTVWFVRMMFNPNDTNPAIREVAQELVRENISTLELTVHQEKDYAKKNEYTDLLVQLAETGNDKDKVLVADSLLNLMKLSLTQTPSDEVKAANRDDYSDPYSQFIGGFKNIVRFGSYNHARLAARAAYARLQGTKDGEKAHAGRVMNKLIDWSYPDNFTYNDYAREVTVLILKEHGFDTMDTDQLIYAWNRYSLKDRKTIPRRNINRIIDLDETKSRSGAAKALYDEFDMRIFHRVPVEVLDLLYDQKDDIDTPSLSALVAVSDHNEAFGNVQFPRFIKGVVQQLKEVGFNLKLYDTEDIAHLKKARSHTEKKYGKDNLKYSFEIAHGTNRFFELAFGFVPSLEMAIRPDQIERGVTLDNIHDWQDSGELDTLFPPGSTNVMISCSTGEPNGIAQELSKGNRTTIAPDREAQLGGLAIEKDASGNLVFKVTFGQAKPVIYKDGVAVTS